MLSTVCNFYCITPISVLAKVGCSWYYRLYYDSCNKAMNSKCISREQDNTRVESMQSCVFLCYTREWAKREEQKIRPYQTSSLYIYSVCHPWIIPHLLNYQPTPQLQYSTPTRTTWWISIHHIVCYGNTFGHLPIILIYPTPIASHFDATSLFINIFLH